MPGVGAADEHRRRRAERHADVACCNQLAGLLVGRPEERVRRAADTQAVTPRRASSCRAVGTDVVSGFSVYTCLPASSATDDRGVRIRRGEIEHDVDLVGRDEVFDRHHLETVGRGQRLGALRVRVGARLDSEGVERGCALA